MAHYQQLRSYIVELTTRSLQSAQAREAQTRDFIREVGRYVLMSSVFSVAASIFLTFSVGRTIAKPITEMSSALTAIAAGNFSIPIPGMRRRDEIGAMTQAVEVFAMVSRNLREREQLLLEAREQAEGVNCTKSA